jgi:peptidase C25-like protein/peptidase S24-like protein
MIEPRPQSAVFGLFARDLIASGNSFRFCARGRSMTPTIQDGDLLVVEPLERRPTKGEIVLFRGEGEFKAHRIVATADGYLITRGDAGMEADGVVRREDILGRVTAKKCGNSGQTQNFGRWERLAFAMSRSTRSALRKLRHRLRGISLALVALVAVANPGIRAVAQGGVALDNANSQGFIVGGGGSTCSASPSGWVCQMAHTDNFGGPNSNTMLVVGVSMNLRNNAGSSVTGVTCNGTTMTAGPNGNPGNGFSAQMFYLANPPLGPCTIQATIQKLGGAGNPIGMVLGAISLYRVNTSGTVAQAPVASGTALTASAVFSATGANDALIDVIAVGSGTTVTANTSTTSPLIFETQLWNTTSGGSGQDVDGISASGGGTGAAVTMRETLSVSTAWTLVAIDIPAQFPTAVKTNSFKANDTGNGVVLSWKTGEEIRNLGFNVYRDSGGTKTKINSSLVAGSALLMRDAAPQHGAKSYAWIDPLPVPGALYWLEDVDLDGTRTMHGPISAESSGEGALLRSSHTVAALSRAQSQLGRSPRPVAPYDAAHVLERTTRPQASALVASNGLQLAAMPAVKILVDHEGWYRLPQPQLVAAGLPANVHANFLHLYAEGVEQPIRITGSHGGFGPQGAIEFYGTAIDTPYSGQRVYWLVEQRKPGLRVPEAAAAGSAAPQAPFFLQTVELKPRTTYFAALLREDTDNFFGPLISPTPDLETVNLSDLAPGEAILKVLLQGVTDGQQHQVTVMLNGATLGDVTFPNQQAGSAQFAVNAGTLTNGANTITLIAQQGANDLSLIDTITLSFPQTYTAQSDALKFKAHAGERISITGFTQPPARLIDITDPLRPVQLRFSWVIENGGYTLHSAAPWGVSEEHTLLALAQAQLGASVGLAPHVPTALHAAQVGAEFVIIAPRQFASPMQPLAAFHQTQGLSSRIVSVQDIYDEFNFGEPSPYAIKAFLKTARAAWTNKPRYLVLGGDASVDPRNYLGFGFFDFVPTKIVSTGQLKTASDDWFSDFNNSGFPTIATGRLGARTASDAQGLVSKILGYANGSLGTWNRQALLVADADDPGLSFTQAAQSVRNLLPPTLTSTSVFAGNLGIPVATQELIAGINNGQLLVNYNGHGSVEVWSSGSLFDDTMAASLTNGSKLPVFVIMNCLNGFFHDVYTQSLAESLMMAPNGGAVAVWASSGLTNAPSQFQMDDQFTTALFSNPAPALGDAILTAKTGISDVDVRRTFILFGDPAMKLRTPDSTAPMVHIPKVPISSRKILER